MTAADPNVVRTMCPMNCHPTFCGMLVQVENGQLKTLSGDKENPDSRGFLCVRGRSTSEIFGNPKRLLYPQIRDDRSTGIWRRVTWDEALDFMEGGGSMGRTWRLHSGRRHDDPIDAAVREYVRMSELAPRNDLLGAWRFWRGPVGRTQGQYQGRHGRELEHDHPLGRKHFEPA
jgi:anaerobic selenocysteine-containing dehydrogenase